MLIKLNKNRMLSRGILKSLVISVITILLGLGIYRAQTYLRQASLDLHLSNVEHIKHTKSILGDETCSGSCRIPFGKQDCLFRSIPAGRLFCKCSMRTCLANKGCQCSNDALQETEEHEQYGGLELLKLY